MNEFFQTRRDELRGSALVNIERRLGPAIKYSLLLAAFLVTWLAHPDVRRPHLFYIYAGILICGTLVYIYFRKRLLSGHRVAYMTLSSCLDVFCISFIYCILAGSSLAPIVFLFLPLPILWLILFYPSVSEFLLAAGLSSAVFLFTTATLAPRQLTLPSFWGYFGSMWPIFGLGMAIVSKLLGQLNRTIRNKQLILQAFQMVSSLVEMTESTARLREKNKILQKSVEIISRVMAVHSCVAWTYQNGMIYPAASDGLDKDQKDRFHKMELSISDIPAFNRALDQKAPLLISDDDLKKAVPSFYRECFDARGMLVIPLINDKYVLGCIALHWQIAPERIASQELAILSGITTQIGITLENVYLMEELREKEEMRGRLLERVISAQEEERKRIARELHDETGQILTVLMVNVELLKTEQGSQSAEFEERLGEISSLLSKTMEDVHNLSLDLHPKILSEFGLAPAIRWYAKNHLERWEIGFGITGDDLDCNLSDKEEICLFRITQEAITNVIRHAQAQQVDIEIGADEKSIYLSIRDDGNGFDVNSHYGESCLGLKGMEERVHFLGGQIDISSEIGKGTEVFVNIPFKQSPEQDVITDAENPCSSC